MGIGPSQKKEDPKVALSVRAIYNAKKISEIFFLSPAHYIFYSALAMGIIVTLFGVGLHWEFLFLLCLTGVLNFCFEKSEIFGAKKKP